ncbi:hypothetical protein DUI87_13193 [Hirundo rustica rustica]|uniref:Reverse transcriptase domain-containing protein n=1 Tax=Hirundo rustica rustica TaxID=333673 RepID=A0A3M0KB20_HIRRU|nr:hypothetical protein DUI87_13193 [Hirundo rustica rustica]
MPPCKIMEKIILVCSEKHLENDTVIGDSQDGSMRGKSFLLKLIFFYDKVSPIADLGKSVDVIFWDFSRAFDTFSRKILLDKNTSSSELDNPVTQRMSNGLTGQAQRLQ